MSLLGPSHLPLCFKDIMGWGGREKRNAGQLVCCGLAREFRCSPLCHHWWTANHSPCYLRKSFVPWFAQFLGDRTQLLLRASTVANGSLSLFNQIPGDVLRMGGSMVS